MPHIGNSYSDHCDSVVLFQTVVKEPEGRTPWNIHEPNNAGNGEDCVYVITTGSPRLNDVNCGKGIFGLCECNSTISGLNFWIGFSLIVEY